MLSTFIKLLLVIKIFVLSILEWPLNTGFTVCLLIAALVPQLCFDIINSAGQWGFPHKV